MQTKKPFLLKDTSIDLTDRSALPLKSIDSTVIVQRNIEMRNFLVDKRSEEKVLDVNRKTDRDFLIASIKCAITKENKLNFEYQMETRISSGIPNRFFDLLAVSQDSRAKYLLLRKSLKKIDIFLCIFGIITITLAAVDNSSIISAYNILTNEFSIPLINNILRIIMASLNFLSSKILINSLVILLFCRYSCVLNIQKARIGSIARKDSLCSTGLVWYLLVEILLHLVTIPPYFEHQLNINGSIYVEYDYGKIFNIDGLYLRPGQNLNNLTIADTLKSPSVNIRLYYTMSAMISFFILFRIYHLFRLNKTMSYWATPKADSICKIMNTKADFSFNLRASLRNRPLVSLSVVIILVLLVSSLATQFFEYYNSVMIYALDETYNMHIVIMQKFSSIYNSFWLTIITMTTVGYGEMYPTTYFARVIAIFSCITGTFVLSAIIVFFINFLTFDELERQVYNEVIRQNEDSNVLRKEACSLVGKLIRYNYLRNVQKDTSAKLRLHLWIDMQYKKETFKIARVSQRKFQSDLVALVGNIDDELKVGVDPLNENLQIFNRNRAVVRYNLIYVYSYRMINRPPFLRKQMISLTNSCKITRRCGIFLRS